MSVSIRQAIEAAMAGESIGSLPSKFIMAIFTHDASWLNAHFIPALRFELSDVFGESLDLCAGGHGCFWTAFTVSDDRPVDWLRWRGLIESDSLAELRHKYNLSSLKVWGA